MKSTELVLSRDSVTENILFGHLGRDERIYVDKNSAITGY